MPTTSVNNSTVFSYDRIVRMIQDYFQQNSQPFINEIPNFIAQAEQVLALSIKGIAQLFNTNWQGGITEVMALPQGWRQMKSVQALNNVTGATAFVLERSYEYCRQFSSECTPAYLNSNGLLPQYYGIYQFDYMILSPYNSSTASNITLRLAYYATPPGLSTVNQNNYWTINYGPTLFLACLVPACLYLRMDERMMELEQALNRMLNAINAEDNQRVNDSSYELKPSLQTQNLG